MKAVVIEKHGSVEGLNVADVSEPLRPTADLVRVRVRAAGLNRADILQRLGRYPTPAGFPQNIPGLEFAGEVDEVGERVSTWHVGQRVFGITAGGAQAEFLNVPENHLAEVPGNFDWAQAAAVPEVFITAHDALFTRAQLSCGENVLIHAAGSGVGTAAIQLAQAAGANVIGTSRTSDKLERAKDFGLIAGVVVNDPAGMVDSISQHTDGRGVDVIIDLVGAKYFDANLKLLAPKGRLIFIGTTAGSQAQLDFSLVMRKRLTIIGTVLRGRSNEEKATATRLFAQNVLPLLAKGKVRPVLDRAYKVEEVRDAHLRLEANENFGKIVLLF